MSSPRRASLRNAQPTQPQPTPSTTTSAPTQPISSTTQQKKARFTRAERRAYARDKAAQNPFQPAQSKKQSKTHTTTAPRGLQTNFQAPNANIDNMIGFLLAQRGAGKKQQQKALNSVFQGFKFEQQEKEGARKGKNKEVSAKKMEKVVKRREERKERKRVVRDERRKEGEGETAAVEVVEAEVEKQPLPADDDEINFDEL